jgi:hypothetical protein
MLANSKTAMQISGMARPGTRNADQDRAERVEVPRAEGPAVFALERFRQDEETEREVQRRQPRRQPERRRDVPCGRKPPQGRADDEADAEGRADQPEPRRAFPGRMRYRRYRPSR